MENIVVQLYRFREADADIPLPSYETTGAAGMDVAAAVSEVVVIHPGEIALIPTGFGVALPSGYEMQVRPRSGLALKYGITLINSPGTIDADYRGEVKVPLINHGKRPFVVNRGDRIAQLVVAQVAAVTLVSVESLPPTSRNDGGFGHTGK